MAWSKGAILFVKKRKLLHEKGKKKNSKAQLFYFCAALEQ